MSEEKEYKELIAGLREERLSNREKVVKITAELTRAISGLNGGGNDSMVSIKDFEDLLIGEVVNINEKISIEKYRDTEFEICFKTYVKAGARFGVHQHDAEEHTTVLKGHLIELLDNKKLYSVGETVVYLSEVLHEPSCDVDSEYDVIFKKLN
jgi:hypothetical protein